jgi:hypothetical protein
MRGLTPDILGNGAQQPSSPSSPASELEPSASRRDGVVNTAWDKTLTRLAVVGKVVWVLDGEVDGE